MELGARVCVPRKPRCEECPLALECLALKQGRQAELPRRPARAELPTRDTLVLLLQAADGSTLARRRGDDGMLRGLWELPGAERLVQPAADPTVAWRELDVELRRELGLNAEAVETGTLGFRHGYSHFLARVQARRLRLRAPWNPGADYCWLTPAECARLGFSARDRRILEESTWDLPEEGGPA
jgi:A/G-specific adenine glycosylase